MGRKLRVALLAGGTSSERSVSLKGGDQVFAALDKERYDIRRYDPQTDIHRLAADAKEIDVALIILHGLFGEDGTVQGFLDLLNIPYQCTGVLGSSVAMNKLVAKQFYERAKIPVPAYQAFSASDRIDITALIDRIGLPMVIKPACGGSSIGMTIAKSQSDLDTAFKEAFLQDQTVLAEEYIRGTEITGGVLGNACPEALPIIEIVPQKSHEFFDYHAKYAAGETLEICPARIDAAMTARAQQLAIAAHKALYCSGCSRTDMIIRDGNIYVLETNTIPGMTETSLLPLAARTAGMTYSVLLDRLILCAMEKKRDESERSAKAQAAGSH